MFKYILLISLLVGSSQAFGSCESCKEGYAQFAAYYDNSESVQVEVSNIIDLVCFELDPHNVVQCVEDVQDFWPVVDDLIFTSPTIVEYFCTSEGMCGDDEIQHDQVERKERYTFQTFVCFKFDKIMIT